MKKYFLLLCTVVIGAIVAHSQSIKMKIASVTPAAGETILAYQNSNSSPVSNTSGGGPSIGVPAFTEIKIKKAAGGSSTEFFKRSVLGSALAEITFEWYDAANTLFYRVVLKDAFTIGFSNLSPECSSCTTLSNEVSFVPKKIELTDVITGVTIRYDLATRTTY